MWATKRPCMTTAEPSDVGDWLAVGAVLTTYKGINVSEAKPGEWLAMSGAGGVGHLAIQYAKIMGLRVCAIDVDDAKLAHAKRLGADIVVNAKTEDPAAAVKKANHQDLPRLPFRARDAHLAFDRSLAVTP